MKSPMDELIQWNADTMRLLNIGLRNHDPVTVGAVYERIAARLGEEFATETICRRISSLMNEGWVFAKEGFVSPLI